MPELLDDVRVGVIGLGYVGLPLALAAAARFPTAGYDLNPDRVAQLRRGHDSTGEVTEAQLGESNIDFTSTTSLIKLQDANFYVVTVPTPVDTQNRPDLSALRKASRDVGAMLRPGDAVVYESTVYPGVTEEVCLPILCEVSGLIPEQFVLGYSPERINPGDPDRNFRTIKKVVGATTPHGLEHVASVYEELVVAVHRAPTVRVAEASKAVENIQRDVNIALVNELAVIFDRLGMRSSDVFAAAATKWNWHPYTPGLVGGHCIGVDPYYMAAKAEEVGVSPQVLLSGRRINDSMGAFVGQRVAREMALAGTILKGATVLLLGAAFKPNVGDVRNSKSFDVAEELQSYGCSVVFYDPCVEPLEIRERGFAVIVEGDLLELEPEAIVLAVAHKGMDELARAKITGGSPACRVLADLHGVVGQEKVAQYKDGTPTRIRYWRL